jgi:hypothetical protein
MWRTHSCVRVDTRVDTRSVHAEYVTELLKLPTKFCGDAGRLRRSPSVMVFGNIFLVIIVFTVNHD